MALASYIPSGITLLKYLNFMGMEEKPVVQLKPLVAGGSASIPLLMYHVRVGGHVQTQPCSLCTPLPLLPSETLCYPLVWGGIQERNIGVKREAFLGLLRNLLLTEEFRLDMGVDLARELKRTPAGVAISAWQAQLTRCPVEAAVAVALSCPRVPVVTGAVAIARGLWSPWASWKVGKEE